MKPQDRALDIAVVGLGQAGGNIATEFHRRGLRALALNTASTDLAALESGGMYPGMPAERRIYIGLEGYDGAGADPSYGAECVSVNEDRIRSVVVEDAADADALIVCAGLGGGTGSAVNALVNVLKHSDIPMIGMFTLPTEAESAVAKVNTVRAINELVDAPLSAWIFVDNARFATTNQHVAVSEYYPLINQKLCAPIDSFNLLNERSDIVPIRAFDGEDFRKLLLSGGVLNYGTVQLDRITVEDVAGAVRKCLEASDIMPPGFDIGTVSHVGHVIEAPDSALTATPISVFEEIDDKLKHETGGAAVSRGVYRKDSEGITLRIIAATRSLPHRVRELLAAARHEGAILQDKLHEQLPTLELGDIETFELFRPEARNRASDRPRRARKSNLPETSRLDSIRNRRSSSAGKASEDAKSASEGE